MHEAYLNFTDAARSGMHQFDKNEREKEGMPRIDIQGGKKLAKFLRDTSIPSREEITEMCKHARQELFAS